MCGKVEPIVNGLAKDYEGKIECKVVKYDEGDSPDRIKRYGLTQHGMVITDQNDKVVWSESGHKQTRNGVIVAINQAIGG